MNKVNFAPGFRIIVGNDIVIAIVFLAFFSSFPGTGKVLLLGSTVQVFVLVIKVSTPRSILTAFLSCPDSSKHPCDRESAGI